MSNLSPGFPDSSTTFPSSTPGSWVPAKCHRCAVNFMLESSASAKPGLRIFSSTSEPHCGHPARLAAQLGQAGICWQGLNTTLEKMENVEVGFKATSASDSLHSWHFPNSVASSTYLGNCCVIVGGNFGFLAAFYFSFVTERLTFVSIKKTKSDLRQKSSV